MKAFVLILFSTTLTALVAQAQSSFVYSCRFTDEINATSSLRMKEYFDESTNSVLGKVDLLVGEDIAESTKTHVLEVPIWESDTYVKMWYAPQLRIDAILSWSTSSREFAATYLKDSIKKPIYCSRLSD